MDRQALQGFTRKALHDLRRGAGGFEQVGDVLPWTDPCPHMHSQSLLYCFYYS